MSARVFSAEEVPAPLEVRWGDPHGEPTLVQMADDPAAEEPGPAKDRDAEGVTAGAQRGGSARS